MPGRYTEPRSRKPPDQRSEAATRGCCRRTPAASNAPSYAYQATCPNDQNLIHLQGRAFGARPSPSPRAGDRRGMPDEGRCIRCNIQVEGSGVMPEDVNLDAGGKYPAGKEKDPNSKPGGHAKHVVFRADRADGFVGRNVLFKGALEHGYYTEETDGVRLDRTKFFWNADYGHLSFTSDHHLVAELRRLRLGRLGGLPRRRAGDGRPAQLASGPTLRARTRRSPTATCAARRSATRARWATPCASPATTSTATPPASPATRSPPPATPASRPTARRSTTTHLLQQPRPLQARRRR